MKHDDGDVLQRGVGATGGVELLEGVEHGAGHLVRRIRQIARAERGESDRTQALRLVENREHELLELLQAAKRASA